MRVLELETWYRLVKRVALLVVPGRRPRHRPVHAVTFGGREFSAPQLLSEALVPSAPGCYAIQVRNWWGAMKPIHFGASHDLHEELSEDGPIGFVHMLSLGESRRGIFVSFAVDHELDHHSRHLEGMRLNRHYFPERAHSVEEHLAHHRIHRSSHRQPI